MENIQKKEFSLKDFADILIPKIWIILLTAVVFAASVFTFSFTRKDEYTSSAKILVMIEPTSVNTQYYEATVIKTVISKYESLMTSNTFYDAIRAAVKADPEINLDLTRKQFKSIYSFTSSPEEQTLTFSITHEDKNKALAIAEIVEEYFETIVRPSFESDAFKPETLTLASPEHAENPDSKNTVRNSLIAFLIGAVLSAALILVLAISDITIRDKKKIEDNFNIPILGIIPAQDFAGGTKPLNAKE